MGVFVCFFQKCFGIWLDFPTHSWLTSELVFVICRKIEKVLCVGVAAPHKKKRKKTRRWLPLQKHQPETSRKVRFLVFAKEFVRFGFVAERALQTRSRRYTDAFFLISRSRACRREDFQDEVRAVPRRGTGGRTQTGTFTRVFWTQTNWNG